MKTIVKIEKKTEISVAPVQGGGVVLEIKTDYGNSTSSEVFRLSSGQVGALIAAMEVTEKYSHIV